MSRSLSLSLLVCPPVPAWLFYSLSVFPFTRVLQLYHRSYNYHTIVRWDNEVYCIIVRTWLTTFLYLHDLPPALGLRQAHARRLLRLTPPPPLTSPPSLSLHVPKCRRRRTANLGESQPFISFFLFRLYIFCC